MRRVVIIGGGAAGLMAALFAARGGASVTLLERNEKLGKKIYITGKGRCNLTNACDRDAFLRRVFRNPRFLYAALSTLDSDATMALMEGLGVALKVERGERVFPVSDKASDVTAALAREIARLGVEVRLESRARSVLSRGGAVCAVALEDGREIPADAVVVATGGMSYPSTGSTGDGYRLAAEHGHALAHPLPALTAIETVQTWPARLAGLTLKNVRLRCEVASAKARRIFNEQGELLFTHFGISGPLALTLSSLLPEDVTQARIYIDLKPALEEKTLDERLVRDVRALSRKQLSTLMDGLEPHNLGLELCALLDLSPAMTAGNLTQAERRRLVALIKGVPLTPRALRGFSEAIVTRGGIDVRQVNPSKMESRLLRGLYFAGEVLDVDGATGGFNLQIAFSTGALAGKSAAEEVLA